MKASKLESNRLYLEPISTSHISEEYVRWLNDEEVYRYLESGGDYTTDMLKDYIEGAIQKDIYFWGIHLKKNGLHIGNIKIDPINQKHGLGEYGILIGRKTEWGKGYAKEATKIILTYCFQELKIRKLTLGVVSENITALALYKKFGFVVEGVFKRHGLYQGKYCDVVRMALFNETYK